MKRVTRPSRRVVGGLLGAALLVGAAAVAQGPAAPRAAQGVHVQFGGLLWVYARDGLPFINARGRMVAPVVPTCELLGVTCNVNAARGTVDVSVPDGSVTVVPLDRVASPRVPFVELTRLTGVLGLFVKWNARARVANVLGARGGVQHALAALDQGTLGASVAEAALTGPVTASFTPASSGGTLTVTATRDRFTRMTVVAATDTAVTVTGDEVRGSADVPATGAAACGPDARTCRVTLNADVSYALASLAAR